MPELILINAVGSSTITATPPFDSRLPASNLALPQKAACSTSAAAQTVYFNHSAARAANGEGFVLSGRFSPNATLRIRLHSLHYGNGAVLQDSGIIHLLRGASLPTIGQIYSLPMGYFYHRFSAATSEYYLSLSAQLSDPTPPSGRHQLYRAVIGSVFIPRVSTTYESPWEYSLLDTTTLERSDRSDLKATKGHQRRQFRIPLDVTDSERLTLTQAWHQIGKTTEVFAHLMPNDTTGLSHLEHGMIGYFGDAPKFTPTGFDRNRTELPIVESSLGVCQVAVVG
jgi:hypothetical protein